MKRNDTCAAILPQQGITFCKTEETIGKEMVTHCKCECKRSKKSSSCG